MGKQRFSPGGTHVEQLEGREMLAVPEHTGLPGNPTLQSELVRLGGYYYYAGRGGNLYRTDGTWQGTTRIEPSIGSIRDMILVNDTLYFSTGDGVHGEELWRFDGGSSQLVCDIRPGPDSSFPGWLASLNGRLYFSADDGIHGMELWTSDGTAAGTRLFKNINPDTPAIRGSNPQNITAADGMLFLFANNADGLAQLWTSDGTADGTVILQDPGSGWDFTSYHGQTYFFTGNEIWKSDGTRRGTKLVTKLQPISGANGVWSTDLMEYKDRLFFMKADIGPGGNGGDLWSTDGTAAGTRRISSLPPHIQPYELTKAGNTLYFIGGISQVWKSDGTPRGTGLLKSFDGLRVMSLTAGIDGLIYFVVAYSPDPETVEDVQLWQSDGTVQGTRLADRLPAIPVEPPVEPKPPVRPLVINGTAKADTVSITAKRGWVCVTFNGKSRRFSRASISNIVLNTGDGDDRIFIGRGVPRVAVNGGRGDDIIIGGGAHSRLDGGAGHDLIVGRDATQSLFGGTGDDILVAAGGPIDGGKGDDLLFHGKLDSDNRLLNEPDAALNLPTHRMPEPMYRSKFRLTTGYRTEFLHIASTLTGRWI